MEMKANVRTVDMKEVEQRFEENMRQARNIGQRAFRAYVGLWGLAYDEAMMMVDRGKSLFDRAELRGQKIERKARLRLERAGEKIESIGDEIERNLNGRREELPIPGYEGLTVKEIEPLLAGLETGELEVIARYEAAHENRVTLLRAIEDELESRRNAVTD